MSVVFGLSVYTATANSSNFGNENMLLGFGRGGDFNKKVFLQVIAEHMKVCFISM
jgi:hypothetical protein